jgi:hypothetical protein
LDGYRSKMGGMVEDLTTPLDHLTTGDVHPTQKFRRLMAALMEMNMLFIIDSKEPDAALEFLKQSAICAGIERIPVEKYVSLPSFTIAASNQ